jgi:molybdopterin converting factor small subunit
MNELTLMMNVKVRVRVLGVFHDIGEGGEVGLDFQTRPTIRNVILKLMELSPGLQSLLWDDSVDSPFPNALVLLNGVEVNNLEGLETEVSDGSEVVILSVVHGG